MAIARALVGPRRLVLADEPTGALDSATGQAVMEVLLAAVGAPPRIRRRIAATGALVIAGVGATAGTAAGTALGVALVRWELLESTDLFWQVEVPWATLTALALGIPLIAAAGVALVTRNRLPLTRCATR